MASLGHSSPSRWKVRGEYILNLIQLQYLENNFDIPLEIEAQEKRKKKNSNAIQINPVSLTWFAMLETFTKDVGFWLDIGVVDAHITSSVNAEFCL